MCGITNELGRQVFTIDLWDIINELDSVYNYLSVCYHELEKVFKEKTVAVSFFKTVLYTHILNTYLFRSIKSFNHEHPFYLHLYMSVQHTLLF